MNLNSATEITIPNSITHIGEHAFANCERLINLSISDNVTSIGEYAFRGCSQLTSVVIPDSVESIGRNAFNYCPRLTDTYYTGTKEEWARINIESPNDNLSNVTIHYNYVPEE